jgi:hypothetical protein
MHSQRTFRFIFSLTFQVLLAWSVAFGVRPVAWAEDAVSCLCPEPHCAPCEVEVDVDFYTEKCGPGLSKVKSCKRPQCEPVPDQKLCLAKLSQSQPARAVASEVIDTSRSAEVILAVGRAHLKRGDKIQELLKGMHLFAGDRVVTKEDGRVRIRLPELSEIFVSPSSELLVAEALVEKRATGPTKRTILLDLQRGRVRSRVQGRYNDEESKFEVKTRSAVAGVRGTDFTVTFDQGEGNWKTEVRTVTGEVSLDSLGKISQHLPVTTGTYGAFISPAPQDGASSFEVEAALSSGHMTPLSSLSKEDVLELDRSTDVSSNARPPKDSSRAVAVRLDHRDPPLATRQVASSLCRAPAAAFNQCSWTCEGNKKGATSCRSDLPGVQCVRRLCRANGQWAEPTVLPSKQAGECEAAKPVVGDCGGYF